MPNQLGTHYTMALVQAAKASLNDSNSLLLLIHMWSCYVSVAQVHGEGLARV